MSRPRRAPIWTEPAPGSRRPSVTREQIAGAALQIADADGLDAVSMRRVAAALGVGTMTLYHYVRTKDDLYQLMGDTIMRELHVPDDALDPVNWRSSIAAIARASREAFRRHPWMVKALDRGGEIGPNGFKHFEQTLAAMQGTGLPPAEKLQFTAIVDDLVFGHALRVVLEEEELANEAWRQQAFDYAERQLEGGDYPHIRALFDEGSPRADQWARITDELSRADRFELALEALLDGLERRLKR
jgi:AcrR family transcriptional regulator